MIQIVPYNPDWPKFFQAEALKIQEALGNNCIAIHHIGSTSVEGLAAKPWIDIMPVVRDILQVDACNAAMQALGYKVKGESGMLFRRFFYKDDTAPRYNVHIWEEDASEIDLHLKFRDYMRTHPDDRNAYAHLKGILAQKYSNDGKTYSLAKDPFIQEINAKTGYEGLRIVEALTEREWSAYQNIRNSQIFEPLGMQDPYTWTFTAENHRHLVLIKDAHIIGGAHIQLWPSNQATLRVIAIENAYQGRGLGGRFLTSIERWLKHQNVKTLYIYSSQEAYGFFKNFDYRKMPFSDLENCSIDSQNLELGKMLK